MKLRRGERAQGRKEWRDVLRAAILLSLIVLPLSGLLDSCSTYRDGRQLTVAGRLRLVGNEPFTHLVVTDADGRDFLLPDRLRAELIPYIDSEVTVEGRLSIRKLELADHSRTITQYRLTAISVRTPRPDPIRRPPPAPQGYPEAQ